MAEAESTALHRGASDCDHLTALIVIALYQFGCKDIVDIPSVVVEVVAEVTWRSRPSRIAICLRVESVM